MIGTAYLSGAASRLAAVSETPDSPIVAAPQRAWRDWVGLAARLVLGVVLLLAGGLKLGNLEESVYAVRSYRLLPYEVTAPLGYGLPILEVAVGLLLIVGLFTRVAALVGALLMIGFIVAIASVWYRGISIDCGCFGGGGEVDAAKALASYPWEILRDVGLLACASWLLIRPRSALALEDRLFPPVDIH
ncbi:DoxX family membrane protein [Propioniciclava tarda]|uniref:DoxX family membrane protein n=1 Tax=Propioniciclava tarda TaxID=433330 RepID=A0A4V2JSY7_PROTD|nr:DoxX family membrane protein [Propioniciclava tarda]